MISVVIFTLYADVMISYAHDNKILLYNKIVLKYRSPGDNK